MLCPLLTVESSQSQLAGLCMMKAINASEKPHNGFEKLFTDILLDSNL